MARLPHYFYVAFLKLDGLLYDVFFFIFFACALCYISHVCVCVWRCLYDFRTSPKSLVLFGCSLLLCLCVCVGQVSRRTLLVRYLRLFIAKGRQLMLHLLRVRSLQIRGHVRRIVYIYGVVIQPTEKHRVWSGWQ